MTRAVVSLTLTNEQARALAYAASLGLGREEKWADHLAGYRLTAIAARGVLLLATGIAERPAAGAAG